jgi:hypothetical protein
MNNRDGRNAKKRANEKLVTSNTKRNRKMTTLLLDDLDDILNNAVNLKNKESTGAKRGRKKKQPLSDHDNNIDPSLAPQLYFVIIYNFIYISFYIAFIFKKFTFILTNKQN